MEKKNYLQPALISAAIFAVVGTALAIYGGYIIINSEPTGSPFPPGAWMNMVVCLLGAFTALLTIKLHVEEEPVMMMGRGAVIGLVTGLILAALMTLLGMAWEFADPEYSSNVVEAMSRHFEAIPNFPEEQIDKMLADMEAQFTLLGRLKGFGISAALYGVLNALTGMLGVRIFAEKPADELA